MYKDFQLAFRNLWGAGTRTWLNAFVLAISLIVILFFNGLMDGWNNESRKAGIEYEYGFGQLIHNDFDITDPFTYLDAHGSLQQANEHLTPILVRSVTLYPQGRSVQAALKGISASQDIVALPTQYLDSVQSGIPAIIGTRMAVTLNAKQGDEIMMRWRDKNGTYNAMNITIAKVFDCIVPGVDGSQVWIDIDKMRTLTELKGETSYFIADKDYQDSKIDGWHFKTQDELLKNLTDIINSKRSSGFVLYLLFLGIGLLAIFDTQVLSVFRRQKEIGTYIALGMTRWQVVRIFTLEGAMYSVFAVLLAAIFGTPVLWYFAEAGFPVGHGQDMGIIVADVIHPVYSISLILKSALSLIFFATIVSFLPARKIAKLNPVLALKGKGV